MKEITIRGSMKDLNQEQKNKSQELSACREKITLSRQKRRQHMILALISCVGIVILTGILQFNSSEGNAGVKLGESSQSLESVSEMSLLKTLKEQSLRQEDLLKTQTQEVMAKSQYIQSMELQINEQKTELEQLIASHAFLQIECEERAEKLGRLEKEIALLHSQQENDSNINKDLLAQIHKHELKKQDQSKRTSDVKVLHDKALELATLNEKYQDELKQRLTQEQLNRQLKESLSTHQASLQAMEQTCLELKTELAKAKQQHNDYLNNMVQNISSYPEFPTSSLGQISTNRIHTVIKGETLSGISLQYYGTSKRWNDIYEANKEIIPNQNQIKAGLFLIIP
jgi:DNA repair exonuclease SbcCD ATPase subunit